MVSCQRVAAHGLGLELAVRSLHGWIMCLVLTRFFWGGFCSFLGLQHFSPLQSPSIPRVGKLQEKVNGEELMKLINKAAADGHLADFDRETADVRRGRFFGGRWRVGGPSVSVMLACCA